MTVPQLEPPLTVQDVAELTGLSYQSVLAEIATGRLPAKKIRRRYLITRASYDRWLQPDPPRARTRPMPAPARAAPAARGTVGTLKAMTAAATRGEDP